MAGWLGDTGNRIFYRNIDSGKRAALIVGVVGHMNKSSVAWWLGGLVTGWLGDTGNRIFDRNIDSGKRVALIVGVVGHINKSEML